MPDFYDTLGVDKDADGAAIKRAYRARSKQEHPDAGGDANRFHALQTAYDVLKDKEKRAHYDATGEAPGDKLDPDTIAVELLGRVMQAVIANSGAEHLDIVAAMRESLAQQKNEAKANRKKAETEKSRIETIRQRLSTRRRNSPGHLLRILEQNIANMSRQMAQLDEHLRYLDRAGELLGDYLFEPVEREIPDVTSWKRDPNTGHASFFFTR